MEKLKVSFDFDGTLTRPHIQEYAKELIERDIEVWITTSRFNDAQAEIMNDGLYPTHNNDLWKIAEQIGISPKNVYFTNLEKKFIYIRKTNFIFHLDDDMLELYLIQKYSKKTVPIKVTKSQWRQKCEKFLATPKKYSLETIELYKKIRDAQIRLSKKCNIHQTHKK